jgi:hypothetical protein
VNDDFDFDALRDPVAPDPSARQRAAVDARARTLRGHARRTRALAGAASLVAVLAIVAGVVAATRSTGPTITVANPSTTLPPTTTPTTYGPSNNSRFIPPTTTDNGLVVLPVTLPDGESFTMRYPAAMKIARLGFTGTTGINGKLVTMSYTTVQHTYGGAPVATFPGADGGTVSLFHANQRSGYVGSDGEELAYQFDKWLVVVDAPVGAADQANWARDLSGTTDASGYLVLHTSGALTVGNTFEGGFGTPQGAGGNAIELAANLYCGAPGSDTSTRRRDTNGDGSHLVAWCDGQLHVVAEGSQTFLDHAANDLQVGALAAPGAAPTTTTSPATTTTTAPVATPSPAVSASFVSPNQGFALEQNGRVDATSDGGATWTVAGSLPAGNWQEGRIRFIGPSDGFAFYPYAKLYITHDAGATWTTVAAPFRTPVDLAILNGKIYAVGLPPKNADSFGIWSTPVEHLVWKRDPLSLPIGAGPVPSVQIVLSGTSGWIIENDRTVIAGARLQSDGTWASWNPPCIGKGGPASLAASTTNDLVALCNEGVWTGPKVTPVVYFSHDAGATFTRHVAPLYAAIASGGPNDAVVLSGNTLQRTIDQGLTWRLVYSVHNEAGDSSEIGFTTSTQGYAIIQDGTMLMTHDGGATWKAVMLP